MSARLVRPPARPRAWCDRLYRPPCWHPEPQAQPAGLETLAADFVPAPGRSREQAQRWQHADLAGLDDQELYRERQRAAFAAAWLSDDAGRSWCEERLKAIASEQARRRGRKVDHGR